MKITIPNNNLSERQYILDVLFSEFLGIPIDVVVDNTILDWTIEFDNSILTFADKFFNKHKEDLSYLKFENLPKKVSYVSNGFIVEENIPVLYGNDKLEIKKNEIYCGIDIFASSFFMLTRWEEYVNPNRDNHNRFPAIESIALKNNFLDRPIVNEYIEMLWNMLVYLGYSKIRKERQFSFMTTHDVDIPKQYKSFGRVVRMIGGEILKRKNIKKAFLIFYDACLVTFKMKKDPFNTFDWLMDVSEEVGIKSYFFFMGHGITDYDNHYKSSDKFIKKLVRRIKQRGHNIGMHPTYDAYNNDVQFKLEKIELEKNIKKQMRFGREHYLRFEVPTTWQIWEDSGMEWDSTCSYADKEGFRCGVCYDYSVFNILTRKQLSLKEKPLIVMEGSFTTYQPNIEPKEMERKILALKNKVRKFQGVFVFLWHNSSFNTVEFKRYANVYRNILK